MTYGVQLYSVSQPIEPQDPREFNPLNSDAAFINQTISQLTSRIESQNFRRRHKIGMPARIRDQGLPAGTIAFGYRKPPGHESERKAIPVVDPQRASLVIRIKDLFLAGQSLPQIVEYLKTQSLKTARGVEWNIESVRRILHNPYYAGILHYGKSRRSIDAHGRVVILDIPKNKWITAAGAHKPLWDHATHQRILEEFHRRNKSYRGRATLRLSHLLYCGVCGARLWVYYPGGFSDRWRTWACHVDSSHFKERDTSLMPRFASSLTAALKNYKAIRPVERSGDALLMKSTISTINDKKRRLTDAYEAGVMPLTDYSKRLSDLDAQLEDINATTEQIENAAINQQERINALGTLAQMLTKAPQYLQKAKPQEVNNHLRHILNKVILHTDGQIEFEFI